MKKAIEIAALMSVAWLLSGCQMPEAIGNALYDPVTSTNTITTPEGAQMEVVSTNGWVLRPIVSSGVQVAGDVAPFPWSGAAATALLGLLTAGAHWRSRRWKEAAKSGILTAQRFKQELSKLDPNKAQLIKNDAKTQQKLANTEKLVQAILNELSR